MLSCVKSYSSMYTLPVLLRLDRKDKGISTLSLMEGLAQALAGAGGVSQKPRAANVCEATQQSLLLF